MSFNYKVVELVFGFDKEAGPKYVAKSVTGEMLTFDKVRNQVCQVCGVHRGVANLVLDGLLDVMVNNLDMGHSVQLGEFGTLRPGIRAKAQDSLEAVDVTTIYRRKINFTPGKMLRNFLTDVSVTRVGKKETPGGNNNGNNPGADEDDDPTA